MGKDNRKLRERELADRVAVVMMVIKKPVSFYDLAVIFGVTAGELNRALVCDSRFTGLAPSPLKVELDRKITVRHQNYNSQTIVTLLHSFDAFVAALDDTKEISAALIAYQKSMQAAFKDAA